MKCLIVLVLLSLMRATLAADGRLPDGWHETKAQGFGSREVVVRAEVGSSKEGGCTGWRWGAENECPRSVLLGLTVSVDGEQIFVPRNAFADLGLPIKVVLKTSMSSLDVVIKGGDAAAAYTATLKFSKIELKRRRVTGDEFKKTAWEDTTYSFPK
jgi:hypothetical protein